MRSKKTGGSKGIAFVEFDHSEVAEIVARSLDNYYLGGLIIKTRLVPKSEIKNDKRLFKTKAPVNPRLPKATPSQSPEKKEALRKRKMANRLKTLEALGLREVFEQKQ